jgi:hypothetical protein
MAGAVSAVAVAAGEVGAEALGVLEDEPGAWQPTVISARDAARQPARVTVLDDEFCMFFIVCWGSELV